MTQTPYNTFLDLTSKIDELRFEPWVGNGFETTPDLKVLIVGESHYGDKHNTLTVEVVRDFAIKGRHAFFTRCASLVTGLPGDWLNRGGFWSRVSFANLSQDSVEGPRAPSDFDAMLRASVPLVEVIRSIEPSHAILLGNQVWNALESKGILVETAKHEFEHGESYYHGIVAGTPIFWSYHPSSYGRFSWEQSSQHFGHFLQRTSVREESVSSLIDASSCSPPQSQTLLGYRS